MNLNIKQTIFHSEISLFCGVKRVNIHSRKYITATKAEKIKIHTSFLYRFDILFIVLHTVN